MSVVAVVESKQRLFFNALGKEQHLAGRAPAIIGPGRSAEEMISDRRISQGALPLTQGAGKGLNGSGGLEG
jgi:hypothetical protein